eukprot:4217902-Alexandrium_andersonii.AAC.1
MSPLVEQALARRDRRVINTSGIRDGEQRLAVRFMVDWMRQRAAARAAHLPLDSARPHVVAVLHLTGLM